MRLMRSWCCILSVLVCGAGSGLGQDAGAPAAPPATAAAQDAASAQAKGAITGTINDQAGAGVAGATVTVTNSNGVSQTVNADDQGQYAATDLPAGSYKVSIVARGAKIFEATLALSPGQVLTLSVAGAPVAQTGAAPTPPPAPNGTAPPPSPAPAPSGAPAAQPAPAAPSTVTASGTGQGSIGGSVNDQTGAVVVGVEVKVSNATGLSQTAVTGPQGTYSIKGLPAGTYNLTATAPGFKVYRADNISLAAGQDLPLDVGLEPAGLTTEVNVEGSKVANVESENAEVSGTITQKEVVKLQLNGRNFTQLITLTPGVSNQTGQDEAKVGVTGSVKYSVNGGRVEYNTFEVDGSDVLNAGLNAAESTLVVYPSLDAIQEVKVLTSNYGAQYGRTASGTVLVNTKSGTNQWHGDVYEFLRNEDFNARNYFDQTKSAPLYRRNDFGFTLGGPVSIPGVFNVKKDKTFVFWSEEFRIENSPSDLEPNFNHAVPTLAERQGNFSDVCPNPFDPLDAKHLIQTGSGPAFPVSLWPDCPGNSNGAPAGARFMLNASGANNSGAKNTLINGRANGILTNLDPASLAILNQNLIPLPNSYTGCNSSLVGQVDHTTGQLIMPCYDAVISEPTYWREELFRVDQNFTSKLRASFRYIHDSWDTTTPTPEWGTVKNTFPTVQNRFVGPGISLVAHLTHTISPSLLNEFVASYSDSHITLANKNGPGGANFQRPAALQCSPTDLVNCNFGYIFNNGFGGKAPGVSVLGDNQAYGGAGFTVDPSYMPWEHTSPIYSFRDDITKVVGKHTLQFGVQYVIAQKNEINGAVGAASGDTQGLLTFSNTNAGLFNLGNAFANFLAKITNVTGATVNNIESYTQDSTQLKYYNHYQIGEPYFQDDWRVNSRLTLNLGLRVSFFGTYHEKYLRAYNWDPSQYSLTLASQLRVDPITGQLDDGSRSSRPIPLNLTSLDPRITNGLVLCGVNGVPAGCMKNHLFNPAPRIGFAWDPQGNGKTSIRAGYGIFFEHGTGQEANTGSLEGSAPNVLSITQPFPPSFPCIGFAAAADAGSECGTTPLGLSLMPGAFPINVTAIPTKAQWPYSQQWSFSVQRDLPSNFVTSFAYVGSKGTHLTVDRQLNQLHPVTAGKNPFALNEPLIPGTDCSTGGAFGLSNGTIVSAQNPAFINLQTACAGVRPTTGTPFNVNTVRPFIGLAQIFSLQNGADSSYHAFQTTLRRTAGPLTAGVAYSYSHSIDDSSDRSDTTFVNSYDLRSNRASSNFDQRHLLNISYVYQLQGLTKYIRNFWAHVDDKPDENGSYPPVTPLPNEKLTYASRALWEGWEISGITTFQSGTPFSVVNNGGSSGIGVPDNAGVANNVGLGSYPDLASNPAPAALKKNPGSFGPLLLNPNLFVAPRGLTFGNAGRNFLNNPHRINFDMALAKHFPVHGERSQLEFRAEAFNIFNHTQFRIYNPDLGNTGSNTISCYGGPNYSAGFFQPGGIDCLTGNSFLHPVDAHRPRTLQLALKLSF